MRSLLERHCPPDSSDYDNRTGLMLAAVKGHSEVRVGWDDGSKPGQVTKLTPGYGALGLLAPFPWSHLLCAGRAPAAAVGRPPLRCKALPRLAANGTVC